MVFLPKQAELGQIVKKIICKIQDNIVKKYLKDTLYYTLQA